MNAFYKGSSMKALDTSSKSRRGAGALILAAALALSQEAFASTYYIDFAGGLDSNAGTAASAAFKHCPGDAEAAGNAAAVKLQPGDRVLFKGGVAYLGTLSITASGTEEKPLVFEGNTDGAFGSGKAIIDGAEPLTGWKRCASAAEAKGNPRWADIFTVDVPSPKAWNSLNLCDATSPLPIAQEPNPKDPFFQEDPSGYAQSENPLVIDCPIRVVPGPGLHVNPSCPLNLMITKDPDNFAVVSPISGGSFTVELAKPVTVNSVGIYPQPTYAAVKEVAFYGDGVELLKVSLEKEKAEIQKFALPQAATFSKFGVKLLSAVDPKDGWTKIHQVAAYAADGTNVLERSGANQGHTTLTDPKLLNPPEADYYKGMIFAFNGGHNFIQYLPVESFDPAAHRLTLPMFNDNIFPKTSYSFFNSVRLIDQPGEYCVEPLADSKLSRVYLLPKKLAEGQPADIGVAKRGKGIALQTASHVVVQGFIVRRQNDAGINSAGPAENNVFRDCEVSLVRGSGGLGAQQINRILVERCNIHDNPGSTRGLVLHSCKKAVTRDCRLVKNTLTALDYYTCTDGQVVGCTVLDNRGMHANGLTFYSGCKNIVVERNLVARGNTCLTFSWIENLVVRNNIFAGSMGVGMWEEGTDKNIQILNNTIIRTDPDSGYSLGLFIGIKAIEGLVVRNNILDGVYSQDDEPRFKANRKGPGVLKSATFNNNLYTRRGPEQKEALFGQDELFESDLKKIFVAPDNDDYRLKAGSPAIGAGVEVDVEEDFAGTKVAKGKARDLGAYQYKVER